MKVSLPWSITMKLAWSDSFLLRPYLFESFFILNIMPSLIAWTGVLISVIRLIACCDSGRFSFLNSPSGFAIWIFTLLGNGDGNLVCMVCVGGLCI